MLLLALSAPEKQPYLYNVITSSTRHSQVWRLPISSLLQISSITSVVKVYIRNQSFIDIGMGLFGDPITMPELYFKSKYVKFVKWLLLV